MIGRRPTSTRGAPRSLPRRTRSAGLSNRERLFWVLGLGVLGLGLVWLLRSLFAVLFASIALAYLLDPLIDRFEARGIKREWAIGGVFSATLLVGTGALLVIVPAVGAEFSELSGNVGQYLDQLGTQIAEARVWLQTTAGVELPATEQELLAELQGALSPAEEGQDPGLASLLHQVAPDLAGWAKQALTGALSSGIGFVLKLLNLALLPVFTFYLLRDWDRLVAGVDDLVPPRNRPLVRRLAVQIDERLSSFVRGQILVAGAQGVMYSVGLLLAGIDLAIAVGVLSGVLAVVPYLGTAVGIGLASLLAVLKFGLDWHLLAVWGTFAFAQVVEGVYLTPRILGDKVGIHPLVVMLALIVGGNLFGIWGMLLAIPVTATAMVLLQEWMTKYRGSRFFQTGRSAS